MKKLTALLLCAAFAFGMLTGCGGGAETGPEESGGSSAVVEKPEEQELPAASSGGEPTEEPIRLEPPEVDSDGAYLMLDASDAYDGAYSFVADEAGTYAFEAANAEGYEAVTWSILVLDEPVSEGEAAKLWESSAYDLEGDGSLAIQAGQYVYCVCSLNASNSEQAVSGASVLVVRFTPDPESEPQTPQETKEVVIDASEAFSGGVYSFQASQDGTYQAVSVTEEGFRPADLGCDVEEVEWSFYVLDEAFEESVRYLPQAYDSVLTGDGSFAVKEGQYVYCMCNINSFTAEKMPEGKNTLTLRMQE